MKRSLPLAMISIMQLGTTRPIRSTQIDLHERRPPTSTQRAGREGRSAIICSTSFHVTVWVDKHRERKARRIAPALHRTTETTTTSSPCSLQLLPHTCDSRVALSFCFAGFPIRLILEIPPNTTGHLILLYLFLDLLLHLDS